MIGKQPALARTGPLRDRMIIICNINLKANTMLGYIVEIDVQVRIHFLIFTVRLKIVTYNSVFLKMQINRSFYKNGICLLQKE